MAGSPHRGADVVVIGGGVIGASIAYESARRGASVLVLDGGAGPGAGCSYANAGLLSPAHVEPLATPKNVAAGVRFLFSPRSPFHVHPDPRLVPWLARFVRSAGPSRARRLTARMRRLAADSLRLHADYAAAGLDTGFQRRGALDVHLTERGWSRALAAAHPSADARWLDADQARELEPSLGRLAGAVYHPEDAQVGSRSFVRSTLEAAARHGARVSWGTPVTRLVRAGARLCGVETAEGTVGADHVVLAAGLGSAALGRGIGLRLPLRGAKGYVVDLDVAGAAPRIPVTFKERRVVATPYADRLRLSGTLELGDDTPTVNQRRVLAIRDAGRLGLPRLDVRRTLETWAGLRPSTPDGVPAIGRTGRADNLVVATGHGMWGLVLAPVTGELVAQGIVEDAPVLAETDFSPDRFAAPTRAARAKPVVPIR